MLSFFGEIISFAGEMFSLQVLKYIYTYSINFRQQHSSLKLQIVEYIILTRSSHHHCIFVNLVNIMLPTVLCHAFLSEHTNFSLSMFVGRSCVRFMSEKSLMFFYRCVQPGGFRPANRFCWWSDKTFECLLCRCICGDSE